MELDNRKKRILQAIVNEYIDTIEPVSSGSITKKYGLDCSSATIRNEMAELEKIGYLEKTHTSSGRIPSDKGYRFYVDEFLNDRAIKLEEIQYIKSKLEAKVGQMEDLTKIATNTISEITHYTTVAVGPKASIQTIEDVKFVLLGSRMLMAIILTDNGIIKETIIKFDEDISEEQVSTLQYIFNNQLKGKSLSEIDKPMEEYIMTQMNSRLDVIRPIMQQINKAVNEETSMYLKGTNQLLDFPEFKSMKFTRKFLGLLEQKEIVQEILNHRLSQDVNIYIGEENPFNDWKDLSVITFRNRVGDKDLGTIGIIGPTRMDYSKVISVMKYIKEELNKDKK